MQKMSVSPLCYRNFMNIFFSSLCWKAMSTDKLVYAVSEQSVSSKPLQRSPFAVAGMWSSWAKVYS